VGVVSAYAGIPNTVIGCSLMSSAIIFAMICLRSVASVVLIGISYGYFAGVCACMFLHSSDAHQVSASGIGIIAPLISHLTPEISDIG
jgi:ABC-type enterobactin transport system permease subunit